MVLWLFQWYLFITTTYLAIYFIIYTMVPTRSQLLVYFHAKDKGHTRPYHFFQKERYPWNVTWPGHLLFSVQSQWEYCVLLCQSSNVFCWPCLLISTNNNSWIKEGVLDLRYIMHTLYKHKDSTQHLKGKF